MNIPIMFKFGLSEIFNCSWTEKKGKKGYSILAGLKISYIRVGTDIAEQYPATINLSRGVTTQLWQSRQVISFSTEKNESQIKANLKIRIEDLKALLGDITSIDTIFENIKLTIEADIKKYMQVSQFSNLAEHNRIVKELNWNSVANPKVIEKGKEWNTVMSTHTHISDLKDLVLKSNTWGVLKKGFFFIWPL